MEEWSVRDDRPYPRPAERSYAWLVPALTIALIAAVAAGAYWWQVRGHKAWLEFTGEAPQAAAPAPAAPAAPKPEEKAARVRELQDSGKRVAMVGDGINDAPVLAQADLSFAMGQGAALAKLQADAVLLHDRLSDLVAARRIAQRTRRVIRQNLTWAAAYNAACVPLALAGFMPPWAAGLGMAASSLAVVLNALRLAR